MPSTMLLRNYETLFHISILLTFFVRTSKNLTSLSIFILYQNLFRLWSNESIFHDKSTHTIFTCRIQTVVLCVFLSNLLYFSYSFHVLKTKPLTHDLKIISIFPKGGRVWKFSGSSSLNMNNLSFPVGRFIVILTVKFSQTCIVERIASQRKIAATKD